MTALFCAAKLKDTKFLTSSVVGGFAPPIAAVTLLHRRLLITLLFTLSEGPFTANETVPIWLIVLIPILLDKPPPILYWINKVVFGVKAAPKA